MCHLPRAWMSNIKEKRWKPRLPVLVDLLTGSMATKLRFLIVVPTRPRATPLPLMTKKTAIHGFLSVLRLATHRVTELPNEWGNVHDYILRTRRPSLGYVVAVVSTHLISSHLIPHRTRGTPKDIQKYSPRIPVFRRRCCGLPWLHPISFSSPSLCTLPPGPAWRSYCSLTKWASMHATIWIIKHTNRIHREHLHFGWKSNTPHHIWSRNTLWDGYGIYHAKVVTCYSRSLNFWIQEA